MNGQNSMPCSPENQSTLVAGKKRIRSASVCVWLSPDKQAKSGSVWQMWAFVTFRRI